MHGRALENRAAVASATIPVERIAGPVLLLGAARDGVWPSARMARAAAQRLQEADFAHEVRLRIFDHDHYLLERADVRREIVTFLTRTARTAGCMPPIAR
jgi:homoserine acetyltransferase